MHLLEGLAEALMLGPVSMALGRCSSIKWTNTCFNLRSVQQNDWNSMAVMLWLHGFSRRVGVSEPDCGEGYNRRSQKEVQRLDEADHHFPHDAPPIPVPRGNIWQHFSGFLWQRAQHV